MLAIFATASAGGMATAQDLTDLPPCGEVSGPPFETKPLNFPAQGVERSVEVGGVLMSTGRANIHENGVRLPLEVRYTGKRAGATYEIIIPAGDYPGSLWTEKLPYRVGLEAYYSVPAGTFRFVKQKNIVRGVVGLFIDPKTRVLTGRSEGFLSPAFQPLLDIPFELLRCTRPTTGGRRTEIIYTGAAKGVVTLQYREFQDNLARPAFSQDYTFDLASGNELAFRGSRVRVIRVNNAELRYVVLTSGEGAR